MPARAAREILGVVEGCGEMADGFHRTRSSPDGKPIIACMQNALDDAGLAPEAIGYINAHGTGTPENDKMEWVGVSAVFGERAASIPISSNKSMIGHTLTAAGTVEAIFTLLTMRHGRLPPTINYETPDPGAAGRLRAQRRARCAGDARDLQLVRLRRAERLPGAGRCHDPAVCRLPLTMPARRPGHRRPARHRRRRGAGTRRTAGMAITYTYRTAPGETAAAHCRQLDLADRAAVEAFALEQEDAPAWDALVQVSGTTYDTLAAMMDQDAAEQAMQVNFLAFARIARAVVRPMTACAVRADRRDRLGDRACTPARATPPTPRARRRCCLCPHAGDRERASAA